MADLPSPFPLLERLPRTCFPVYRTLGRYKILLETFLASSVTFHTLPMSQIEERSCNFTAPPQLSLTTSMTLSILSLTKLLLVDFWTLRQYSVFPSVQTPMYYHIATHLHLPLLYIEFLNSFLSFTCGSLFSSHIVLRGSSKPHINYEVFEIKNIPRDLVSSDCGRYHDARYVLKKSKSRKFSSIYFFSNIFILIRFYPNSM